MILSYFSGMQKLFESEANVPHVVHRRRSNFLQYKFVIWHRLERMIWDCDMMLQYNKATKSWRYNDVENPST